ncbi:hypothetical protein [Pseudomonas syringae]|uniref:Uncharacterized protein n=1 Tax=Pseudomonas syringae TaxID=317 RepID=A0A085VAE2_PSESX|nr:hypothetical protein [Pseudomonas syringae]KFE52405.1 hypothetical protein IV02_08185 [Pseudomonas syringae]
MSYIIALVRFLDSEQPFPVECFRTDLAAHDQVVVRLGSGQLRYALIVAMKYLNWDCKGRIECKASESSEDHLGDIVLPYGTPINKGITTHAAFVSAAKSLGWIPLKPSQRTYRNALGSTNEKNTAYVLVRRNGIDIKIIENTFRESLRPYSLCQCSLSEGITVRHSLAHTSFNLFEGVLRFCKSFDVNELGLERYFVPVGSSDKRTEELKAMSIARKSQQREMQDIYDACSDGGGGPAYLGDGMWITSAGGIRDEGR